MNYEYTREETLLTIDKVHLSFGDTVVLRDVSAVVKDVHRPGMTQGQVVGFLGPSGRGKTQLFRIIAGLNTPTSGEVLTRRMMHIGEEAMLPIYIGHAGVVDQHYTLLDHRTVGDNLVLAGTLAGRKKKESVDRAKEILAKFQLEAKWNEYPQKLSGGQRQRVAIAQQLMCLRGFLLMDEPFSGLDPVMKEKACELISEVALMDERLTIIVITHDIESAIAISDTLWLLGHDADGKLPGSRIQKEYDLIEMGLAWDPHIKKNPVYTSLTSEITEVFRSL